MLGLVNKMKVRDERGFTLVELLIVIAIIAILAAIAIPQFAAYRARAVVASMVSDARNAATALEAVFGDCQNYGTLAATTGPANPAIAAPANCNAAMPNINISRQNQLTITTANAADSYRVTVVNAASNRGNVVYNNNAGAITCTYSVGNDPC